MWCRSPRTAGLALALLAATSGVAQGLRTVDLESQRALDSGISGPRQVVVDGQTYVLKSGRTLKGPDGTLLLRNGNLDGELLSSRLINRLGGRTPPGEIVRVRGESGVFFLQQWASPAHLPPGSGTPQPQSQYYPRTAGSSTFHVPPGNQRFHRSEIRRLLAVDLVTGNVDRHAGNLLLAPDGDGVLRPLAIDGNYSFLTKGVSPHQPFFSNAFAPEDVIYRNGLYRDVALDPQGKADLFEESRRVRSTLTDAEIDRMVRDIPDEALSGRKKRRRRKELADGLRLRREALHSWARTELANSPHTQRGAAMLDQLPESAQRGLPTGDQRLLLAHDLAAPGTFRPENSYQTLRAAGLDPAAARTTTEALASSRGVPVAPGQLDAAERRLAELGRGRNPTLAEVRHGRLGGEVARPAFHAERPIQPGGTARARTPGGGDLFGLAAAPAAAPPPPPSPERPRARSIEISSSSTRRVAAPPPPRPPAPTAPAGSAPGSTASPGGSPRPPAPASR